MKNIITTVVFSLFIGVFSILCIVKAPSEISESERRPLMQMPVLNYENVLDGSFMSDFEAYSTDQIPARDYLRRLKANFVLNVLNKKDNNSLYTADGHISKLEYPLNEHMLNNAAEKFKNIYHKYLEGMKVYLSVVPDKNYYLAEKNGYLSMDYNAFIQALQDKCDYMTYIDITKLLSEEDYYKTDSHWKMDKITHVAEHIGNAMGTDVKTEYDKIALDNPFYGVYAGQSALNVKADEIVYLTNKTLENCIVTYYDTGKGVAGDMYNMEKAYGKDPYEMFLSGSTPLCTIENPDADSEKELIIFRDSFGSSLAPLLTEGYSKITVVDIRYIQSDFLGSFIDFENQDVLFLYSTMLLNNSLALR